jgi:hypothetical protein
LQTIGFLHCRNSFSRTVALGSTQSPTEMSTRCISWWGKGGRCVGLTTLPPSSVDCLEILGTSNSWITKSLSRPVMGLLYCLLYLYICSHQCDDYTRGALFQNLGTTSKFQAPEECHEASSIPRTHKY